MRTAFCLLNHPLTAKQIEELRGKFGVVQIKYPTQELSAQWSQVSATENTDMELIAFVTEWLQSARKNDILIIQGEFGTTFMLVDWALKQGLVPLHAVTRRIAKEQQNGETVHRQYVFEHICFRKYEYFR